MWQQRVLVAAEPGQQGRQLVDVAAAVAAECHLPLVVLSVAESARQAEAEAFVLESVARLKKRGPDAQGRVLVGRPYEMILQTARELGTDLIVMGHRGEVPLARAVVGGVAQKVIGLAEHPVLVAHTI